MKNLKNQCYICKQIKNPNETILKNINQKGILYYVCKDNLHTKTDKTRA